MATCIDAFSLASGYKSSTQNGQKRSKKKRRTDDGPGSQYIPFPGLCEPLPETPINSPNPKKVRTESHEATEEAVSNADILKAIHGLNDRFSTFAVQKGNSLPEKGVRKHYKPSHRWLRFPCCGRAYPCDVCHVEDQDHPMELANRMICGFCAKEQPYGNGKPCINCGSMMTRGTRTSHWEGGQGCRNKVKMSRNDRQKYANTNKTVSRKVVSEKK